MMKKVYTAENVAAAHIVKSALENAGIESKVQNDHVFGLRGAVSFTPDTLPEVWIVDDSQFDEAQSVIAQKLPIEGDDFDSATESFPDHAIDDQNQADDSPRALSAPARWALFMLLLGGCFFSGILFQRLVLSSLQQDWNGDGTPDQIWRTDVDLSWEVLADWNYDGRMDSRTHCNAFGVPTSQTVDADFDGDFETEFMYSKGLPVQSVSRGSNGKVVVKNTYRHGLLVSSLVDEDDDGEFDERLFFDHHGRVTRREPHQHPK